MIGGVALQSSVTVSKREILQEGNTGFVAMLAILIGELGSAPLYPSCCGLVVQGKRAVV